MKRLNNPGGVCMITRLINEIKKSLDNDIYLSSLITSLTLPDICGKAEFPELSGNKHSKERYTKWYDSHIANYEKNDSINGSDFPYLSGDVLYNLRCSLLHQGNPNVDSRVNIQYFELIVEDKNEFDMYVSSSGIWTHKDFKDNDVIERRLCINIRELCLKICREVELYYIDNKEKFNFFNYNLMKFYPNAKKIWDEKKKLKE